MTGDTWERRMAASAAERAAVEIAEGITRDAADGDTWEAAYRAELAAVAEGRTPQCTRVVGRDMDTGNLHLMCARAGGHDGMHTNGIDGEGARAWI